MQAWAALSAEDTAYSAVPGKSASDTMAAGKDLTLAAIVQVWCESKCTVHSSSSGLRPCCSDADQLPSICRPATMPGQQSLGPLTCAAISSCRAGEDPCAFEQANMPASPLKLPFQAWRLHCLWLVEFADAPFEAACGPLGASCCQIWCHRNTQLNNHALLWPISCGILTALRTPHHTDRFSCIQGLAACQRP